MFHLLQCFTMAVALSRFVAIAIPKIMTSLNDVGTLNVCILFNNDTNFTRKDLIY